MFDMGWSELLLVAVLAIVFVGPKDLPKLMRTVGQLVAKMRGMAREFQNSFEDLARESELDELRKEVANLRDIAMKPLSDMDHTVNMDQAMKAAKTAPETLTLDEGALDEATLDEAFSADAPAKTDARSESEPPADPTPADPTKGAPV